MFMLTAPIYCVLNTTFYNVDLTDQVYILVIHTIVLDKGCCLESSSGAAQLLDDSACFF